MLGNSDFLMKTYFLHFDRLPKEKGKEAKRLKALMK